MKFYLFFLSCFLASTQAFSQMISVEEKTSGYFGKRVVLGITGMFSASSEPQNATYEGFENTITLNKTFGVSLQYALSNSSSIRLAANTNSTSVGIYQGTVERRDASGWSSSIDYGDIYYDGTGYEIKNVRGTPLLTDQCIELEYKYFRSSKGGISPIGSYISGGLAAHNLESDISYITINAYSEDWRGNEIDYTLKYQNPVEKRLLFEAYVKAGYGSMITRFLLLDANVRLGYMPSLLSADASPLQRTVYSRLTNKQILNFELTLGIPF